MSKFKVGDEVAIAAVVKISAIQQHASGKVTYATDRGFCIHEATMDQITLSPKEPKAEEPKPAPKPDPYAKYFTHSKDFESRSKFKIGDLVIRDGKTKTVVGHERDSSNWVWTLDDRDSRPYPNLEHFLSPVPAPEPPKFYTGKVFAEKSIYEGYESRNGKVFEFVNGNCINATPEDSLGFAVSSFDYLCKEADYTKWHEVKSDV